MELTHKIGDRVIYNSDVETFVYDYANYITSLWCPSKFFAIDICIDENDDLKVLEINCASSAGMYLCDVSRILQSLENLNYDYLL